METNSQIGQAKREQSTEKMKPKQATYDNNTVSIKIIHHSKMCYITVRTSCSSQTISKGICDNRAEISAKTLLFSSCNEITSRDSQH